MDGKAPTFARKPAIRQEDDGKRLIFECRIEAEPLPQVTWFHSGVEVKPGARHKVSNGNNANDDREDQNDNFFGPCDIPKIVDSSGKQNFCGNFYLVHYE